LMEILGLRPGEAVDREASGRLERALEEMLEGRPGADARKTTAVAGLVGKVLSADMEISRPEKEFLAETLRGRFGMEEGEIEAVTGLIERHRVELFSIEDYLYARIANEVLDREKKKDLLRTLFAAAASDGSVGPEEEAEIRRISDGLKLSHADYIEARLEFREKLSVLR